MNNLYIDQFNFGIQNQQLNWIAKQALGTLTNDYHVAMFSHVPLVGDANPIDPITNIEVLKSIIKAFLNKTSGTFTFNATDFNASVTVNYSSRTQSNFIGLFGGHRHKKYLYFSDQLGGYTSTVMDCAYVRVAENVGKVTDDTGCIPEFDTKNRTVNRLGFGRGNDLTYTY